MYSHPLASPPLVTPLCPRLYPVPAPAALDIENRQVYTPLQFSEQALVLVPLHFALLLGCHKTRGSRGCGVLADGELKLPFL